MGQNKSYEGLNFSKHFHKDKLTSWSCNKDNKNIDNYFHTVLLCILKVNSVYVTSCNVAGVTLDYSKNDHNCTNTKRERKTTFKISKP